MSLVDYLRKHLRAIQRDGVVAAGYAAGSEAISKTVLRWTIDCLSEPIWDHDWDVCLVLDGCRWDTWVATDGRGGPAWSVGSSSLEWINRTFSPEFEARLSRTGYVTANPNTARTELLDIQLAYLDEIWRDRWDVYAEKTVTPRDVTDRAMWAWARRYELGFDQLIVHYMQPHAPFRSLGGRGGWAPGAEGFQSIWNALRDGDVSRETVVEAYADNLEWVLEDVERWQRMTATNLLVTSDHGNAMGELHEWGHPNRSGNPVVRRVPLARLSGSGETADLDSITPPGEPPATADDTPAAVEERLRGFGYL